MASVTIEELLDRAQQFEQRLESYYAELRDHTEDNGVKLLTYYLSRHRRHLERALDSVGPEELHHIKAVCLKVDVPFDPVMHFAPIDRPVAEVHGRQLLDAAVDYDSLLIKLYRTILDQPIGEEATGFIEGLARLEEKDIVMLKKMIAMNYF